MTATVMLPASSTSSNAAGIGTMITSTLPMMPTGKIRSCQRPNDNPPARGTAPVAIRNSGKKLNDNARNATETS